MNLHTLRDSPLLIAFFCIINLILLFPDYILIFSNNGYIKNDINREYIENYNFYFSSIRNNNNIILFVLSLYFLSLLFIIINYFRFISSILSWILHIIFINNSYFFSYGADYFITFILFINIIFCLPKNVIKKENLNILYSFSLRFLQIHLCIVYFFAGFGKSLGTNWWDGNAMWFISNTYFPYVIKKSIFSGAFIYKFLSISTVLIQLTYFIFINIKYTRMIMLFSIIILHLGIAVFMKLYSFGLIMILLNIIAWSNSYDGNIFEKYKSFLRKRYCFK